ncbi:putative 2-aminoethylphosphonate ABC transporter permease subunit [Rhodovibrionaceae bacterium A322]
MSSLELNAGGSAGLGPVVKPKLSRDDWAMRGFMAVIGLYLIIALALPLYSILSKSFEIRTYFYDQFEMAIDQGQGWEPAKPLSEWAEIYKLDSPSGQARRSNALPGSRIFRDYRKDDNPVQRYRFRNIGDDPSLMDHNLDPVPLGQWVEVDKKQLRDVVIRAGTQFSTSNFGRFFSTPALFNSIYNSIFVSLVTMVITVTLAFVFAYGLTRSCMPFKGAFKSIAMVPILVPSLLSGLSLVYLFGNQGIAKELLMGESIYGPIGIILGSVFFTFPHALIIIITALSVSDARLYEAADVLRTSRSKIFWTVTLPGARYGLISAAFVVFTLTITDFGVPKVIGGQFNVLAVDIYKQVVGQQNFSMGAVVSLILMVPAFLAFGVDRYVSKRQVALLSARAVPYVPKPSAKLDYSMLAFCGFVSLMLLSVLAMSQYAALIKFWPYNHSFTLDHYNFDLADGGGWDSYRNSIVMALLTAVIGTIVVFVGAYMVEKARGMQAGRGFFQFLAMMPMAIPGMVLGLSYIFFFNNPGNPLNFIYGTMAILVVSTVTHFYTVSHLTAVTALKQMDREFESVSQSLKQPMARMFAKVTVPVCLPAILDISVYLFVNAMTTVSAVVFLYSPDTTLAAVAALNMDDAGNLQAAAAMCMLIFYTNVGMRIIHALLTRGVNRQSMAWRHR